MLAYFDQSARFCVHKHNIRLRLVGVASFYIEKSHFLGSLMYALVREVCRS